MTENPLCFVLMPFGTKKNNNGKVIDFDKIYQELIVPAIEKAGLQPLRSDEEALGGIVHKQMFERLIWCDYALADVSIGNPNVYYELGIRHAARNQDTIIIYEKSTPLFFDITASQAIAYEVDDDNNLKNKETILNKLIERIDFAVKTDVADSPLYQLIPELSPPFLDLKHQAKRYKSLRHLADLEEQIAIAQKSKEALIAFIQQVKIPQLDTKTLDLIKACRGYGLFKAMLDIIKELNPNLANLALVQEQKALALNRLGDYKTAEQTLVQLIETKGKTSERLGILGRIYKDLWQQAQEHENTWEAEGYLQKSIDAYVEGFKTDISDAYPGVNAVTMLAIQGENSELLEELLPAVLFVAKTKFHQSPPDYWNIATLVELYIIGRDKEKAKLYFRKLIPLIHQNFEPETTARNLKILRGVRMKRNVEDMWAKEIEDFLVQKAQDLT